MTEIVLFHHAQGLTSGVVALADRFEAAGHTVHLPDVYDGKTFSDLDSGMANAKAIGFQKLLDDAVTAAEGLPADVVYVGLSLGVLPAQQLAQTKPGARGAVLVGSAVPADEFGDTWPAGVPLQIHGMDADPVFVGEGDIDAARVLVSDAGAQLFLYPGDGHLFVDNSLSDYDEAAAELFLERTLALLERVAG
ncbi:MAG TPA: dienelactone hydrolase family protein [Pseudolysinimonas sp.]|nr:dienelactone hydrolase family protein [Pseudolysinimonas sp.]